MLIENFDIVPFIRASDHSVRKPFRIGMRSLLDYAILYVQEGTIQVHLLNDKQTHIVRSGQFCCLQPGDIHILEGLTNTISPFVHMDLFYNPNRDQSFVTLAGQVDLSSSSHLMQPKLSNMNGIRLPTVFTPSDPLLFRETLFSLVDAWQTRLGAPHRFQAHKAALQLIYMLIEDHWTATEIVKETPQSLLNWITSYFSLHLSQTLTVEEMAKRVNLSVSRFHVVFRKELGISPHQYFLAMKIRHAKELLRNEQLSMQVIADYCGFSDVHHFAKMFKKLTNQTPNQYRNLQKS